MVVTKIEAVAKNKYKVYLDERFAFVLYKGELSRYRVTVDVYKRQKEGEEFQILLAHNPCYMDLYKAWGADLILSGHLHGGVAVSYTHLPFCEMEQKLKYP